MVVSGWWRLLLRCQQDTSLSSTVAFWWFMVIRALARLKLSSAPPSLMSRLLMGTLQECISPQKSNIVPPNISPPTLRYQGTVFFDYLPFTLRCQDWLPVPHLHPLATNYWHARFFGTVHSAFFRFNHPQKLPAPLFYHNLRLL